MLYIQKKQWLKTKTKKKEVKDDDCSLLGHVRVMSMYVQVNSFCPYQRCQPAYRLQTFLGQTDGMEVKEGRVKCSEERKDEKCTADDGRSVQ